MERGADAVRLDFNPRPREGSDSSDACSFKSAVISIHAPARGATDSLRAAVITAYISIHAPARGATPARRSCAPFLGDFNPRPREGSDFQSVKSNCDFHYFNPRPREGSDAQQAALEYDDRISIHAPARGATAFMRWVCSELRQFQSTPPRGERRCRPCSGPRPRYFNPRPREGSDVAMLSLLSSAVISIHAPARGATSVMLCISGNIRISIHAPARGAT